MAGDDTVPDVYPYAWTADSQLSLQEFLTKYKPSMVQDDGTKPWLWVRKLESLPVKENTNEDAATEEATEYLKEVTEKVEKIQKDASIPTRSNKKKGLRSKKELREEAQAEATVELKEISIRHGFVSGKWLIFAPSDKVDLVWSSVANSLISGPLASTCAYTAKVSTSPQNETENYNHVLCLYMPDVYDKSSVTEVMKVLLRNHGMNLMGVKSNLYTAIGLDSKHPSGIQSTVWKNTALMKDSEIKSLKEEFFAELSAAKSANAEKAAEEKAAPSITAKEKPKLKKKAVEDDPFASDDEDVGGSVRAAEKPTANVSKASGSPAKPQPKPKKRKAPADEHASDSDDSAQEEAKRKAEIDAKKAASRKKPAVAKRPKSDDDSDDEDARPKKKRGGK
ncbi:translation initiation factor eIF 4e-like domain-containing protein [Amylocystis lapponica]|nr:translation initiation factor eIF 4e-like domain-containing protein [Amylocystis lapponica]